MQDINLIRNRDLNCYLPYGLRFENAISCLNKSRLHYRQRKIR